MTYHMCKFQRLGSLPASCRGLQTTCTVTTAHTHTRRLQLQCHRALWLTATQQHLYTHDIHWTHMVKRSLHTTSTPPPATPPTVTPAAAPIADVSNASAEQSSHSEHIQHSSQRRPSMLSHLRNPNFWYFYAQYLLTASLTVVIVVKCIATVHQTAGASMEPLITTDDKLVLVVKKPLLHLLSALGLKRSTADSVFCPGDVVIFQSPFVQEQLMEKRVLAVAGDTVRLVAPRMDSTSEQTLSVDVTVPPDCVWVGGDNQLHSVDSRIFGPVPVERIKGMATHVVAPRPHSIVSRERLGQLYKLTPQPSEYIITAMDVNSKQALSAVFDGRNMMAHDRMSHLQVAEIVQRSQPAKQVDR